MANSTKGKLAFRYQPAVIYWLDAHARNQAVEYTDEEAKTQCHKPEECIILALVIRDDETGVSLYNEETGHDSVRGVSFIPRAMIKDVVYVTLTKAKPKKAQAQSPESATPEKTLHTP